VTRTNRNPIRWHGEAPWDNFTIIPNELARETKLTPYAYQLAIVIRSHADGYEVSMKSLAETLGWKRDTVRKAMDDLVAERWLAVRRYETASGTRAFEEYHLNASRRFTELEAEGFSQPVVLPARQTGNPVPAKWATSCPLNGQPPARQTGTKEDHLEDQQENQEENQHSRFVSNAPVREPVSLPSGPHTIERTAIEHDSPGEYLDECSECFWLKRPCGRVRELVSVGADEPNWGPPRRWDDDECPF
jgi:hypothetical protein